MGLQCRAPIRSFSCPAGVAVPPVCCILWGKALLKVSSMKGNICSLTWGKATTSRIGLFKPVLTQVQMDLGRQTESWKGDRIAVVSLLLIQPPSSPASTPFPPPSPCCADLLMLGNVIDLLVDRHHHLHQWLSSPLRPL